MISPAGFGAFERTLLEEARRAFLALHKRYPGEDFYFLGFYVVSGWQSIAIAGATEQRLDDESRRWRLEDVENLTEWQDEDLPLANEMLEAFFHELIDVDQDALDGGDEELDSRLYETAIRVLRTLDDEGVFGAGAVRSDCAILVVCNDARPGFTGESLRRLNGPGLVERLLPIFEPTVVARVTDHGEKKVHSTSWLELSDDRTMIALGVGSELHLHDGTTYETRTRKRVGRRWSPHHATFGRGGDFLHVVESEYASGRSRITTYLTPSLRKHSTLRLEIEHACRIVLSEDDYHLFVVPRPERLGDVPVLHEVDARCMEARGVRDGVVLSTHRAPYVDMRDRLSSCRLLRACEAMHVTPDPDAHDPSFIDLAHEIGALPDRVHALLRPIAGLRRFAVLPDHKRCAIEVWSKGRNPRYPDALQPRLELLDVDRGSNLGTLEDPTMGWANAMAWMTSEGPIALAMEGHDRRPLILWHVGLHPSG
ncbi:MAG: DUF4303 domain-containing protein [Planctomycetota bacterium]